jgi:RNA-directed DNA polymerase
MSEIVRLLSVETGLPDVMVRKIMASAPVRYKEYLIPKRSGGMRQIAQPAREVKLIQRAFVSTFLTSLPIHQSATAYRAGLSIRDNATPHIGHGPILKLDLRNFFPSIRSQDWVSYCRDSGCLRSEEDVHLTASLLFHRQSGYRLLRLAIGAPSSPILSNILMFDFDTRITELVAKDRVIYTRYADDLTFSAPRAGFLNGVIRVVARTIRALKYPKLEINSEKTTLTTSKYRRTVTGLTITTDDRVTIGRESKRRLHAAVHQALHSRLDSDELQKLAGTLAYVNSVEPEFLAGLRRRYGNDIIIFIQRQVILGHQIGPNRD